MVSTGLLTILLLPQVFDIEGMLILLLVPFVLTVFVTIGASTVLILSPPRWLYDLMQLTKISGGFKLFLLLVATCGFTLSYIAEKSVFMKLAAWIGWFWSTMGGGKKRRKMWKVLEKEMRV